MKTVDAILALLIALMFAGAVAYGWGFWVGTLTPRPAPPTPLAKVYVFKGSFGE